MKKLILTFWESLPFAVSVRVNIIDNCDFLNDLLTKYKGQDIKL